MKEVFGPFFLVISSVTNLKEQFIMVHKLFWQLLWNLLEHISGPKRLLKSPIFEKKANFQWRNNFGLFFSRDIEHAKFQGTVDKGSQGVLTFILQRVSTFIWHLRGRLKQTFRKTAVFTMKEVFGPFFLVISSVTNLKEQFIGVYRLFRQLLWNLFEHFLGPKRLLKSPIFLKKGKFSAKK